MEKSRTFIIVIDDELMAHHPLLVKLQKEFESVKLFKSASDALAFIKTHISDKIILILDMKLSGTEDGHQVLHDLREYSYLIPVIIWTAVPEEKSKFFDLINLKTYAIRDKDTSLEDMVSLVQKADLDIEYSLSNALLKWINAQPGNHDAPYIMMMNGKTYSLNDILHEVVNDTPQGKDFTQSLVNLTIELMAKKK